MIELEKGYAVILMNDGKSNIYAYIVKGYLFDSLVKDCPICVWRNNRLKGWKLTEVNTGLDITFKIYNTRKAAIEDFENLYAAKHAKLVHNDKKYYDQLVSRRERIEKECNL